MFTVAQLENSKPVSAFAVRQFEVEQMSWCIFYFYLFAHNLLHIWIVNDCLNLCKILLCICQLQFCCSSSHLFLNNSVNLSNLLIVTHRCTEDICRNCFLSEFLNTLYKTLQPVSSWFASKFFSWRMKKLSFFIVRIWSHLAPFANLRHAHESLSSAFSPHVLIYIDCFCF